MQHMLDKQIQMEEMTSQHMTNNINQLPQIDVGIEIKENVMTGPRACKICGEIGHLSKECHDEWPHSDASYLDKGYTITQVTCFLCEGTTHILAQCQLYSMVQEVSQQVKDGMYRLLKRSARVQEHKEEAKQDTSLITCYTCREMGHYSWDCPEKKYGDGIKANQFQEGQINHVQIENEARLRTHPNTKVTTKCCYSCEEEGHFSRDCSIKRTTRFPIVEVDYDEEDYKDLFPKERPKKKKKDLSHIECYKCKKTGHYISDCPDWKLEEEGKLNSLKKGLVNHHSTDENHHHNGINHSGGFKASNGGVNIVVHNGHKHENNHNNFHKKDTSQVKCFNCKKMGHYERECPEEPRDMSNVFCHRCREMGHFTDDCPSRKRRHANALLN